jgi:hypothetical protein
MSRLVLGALISSALVLTACDSAPEAEAVAAKPAKDAAADAPAADAPVADAPENAPAPGTDAIPGDTGADDECLYGKHAGECLSPPQVEGNGHFGAPFSLTESRTLANAVGSFDTISGPVQVTGTVGQVCQKKGCWMVMQDGDVQARVLMKDHAFAVPMDGQGASATVEGELTKRTFTAAQVRHIAKDAGKEVPTDAKDSEEYVLTASSVALARS